MSNKNNYNDAWLKQRSRTFVAFCVIGFGLGAEISMVVPSAMFYIENFIPTDYPKLFYGVTISAYPLGSIVGSFVFGKYADKTRNVRRMLLMLIACEIAGNLLYAIYWSPFFPVIGRFLSGFGDVNNMIMVSEIARSYEKEEVTKRMSWLVTFYSVGFVSSPGVNIIVNHVNIKIGSFHISFGNVPGIILALVFCILFLFAFVLVSDLSKEFDLKEHQELLNTMENDIAEKELHQESNSTQMVEIPGNGIKSKASTILQMIKCPEILLLLCLTFLAAYILFAFDTLLSIIMFHYFGLGVKVTSLVFLIDGCGYFVFLLFLGKISKLFADFYLILAMFIVLLLGMTSLLALSIDHSNRALAFTLLAFYQFANMTCWSVEEVLTRSLLSKFVPSRCQSAAEGFRRSVSSVAFIISGVSAAALFDYLEYLASVLCVTSLILFGLFILRRKIMASPKLLLK